jgi:rhodanese-related sulfurtransferase
VAKGPCDDRHVRCIPLHALRARLSELSKDAEIACICQVGMRGYEACLALKASGFSRACYVEGGFRAWTRSAGPKS